MAKKGNKNNDYNKKKTAQPAEQPRPLMNLAPEASPVDSLADALGLFASFVANLAMAEALKSSPTYPPKFNPQPPLPTGAKKDKDELDYHPVIAPRKAPTPGIAQ